jgi:hypothetical protein
MENRLPPPAPPFVELSFYSDDRQDSALFKDILRALSAMGGVPNGTVLAHIVDDPSYSFADPSDLERVEVDVGGFPDVEFERPGLRVVAVDVAKVLRYDREHCVRVTYSRIDLSRTRGDRHPVAVWASGELFSGPRSPSAGEAAAEVRQLFTVLVDGLRPSYGAITMEWSLLSPRDMAAESRAGEDYHDFFLGEAYVGAGGLERVEAAAVGLDIERTQSGIFVFASELFGVRGAGSGSAGRAFAAVISSRSSRPTNG